MAFLDNSGDIILDAVLTDTGRMRLAKGDGSFKITKFALADDEINYGLYDKNNPSGSTYYDLQILQTPVLEAFTNNASSVKSKLLSISRDDLLYLPSMKVYNGTGYEQFDLTGTGENTFIIAVDDTTVKAINGTNSTTSISTNGILNGSRAAGQSGAGSAKIRVDQGLDTNDISDELGIDPDLLETQYLIEMDNRLGFLVASNAPATADLSFIDDDNIATYYLTQGDSGFVTIMTTTTPTNIAGPRGSNLAFRIASSITLKTNNYLFNVLGTAGSQALGSMDGSSSGETYRYIDTFIAITGITTGYRIEVPVRYVKQI
tara:strand:+ start:31 stop:984 length:954 start_codon:yes stop_codon:yes gene_type:complete